MAVELPASPVSLVLVLGLALLSWGAYSALVNIYFTPLSKFPGPKIAAASTLWQAFRECVYGPEFFDVLADLHGTYGDVVRIGPNELHFSEPSAYHDIYNNQNRWDKEYNLYHSFGEDRSSFGFITYPEAKERKDVLNRMFNPKAVAQAQDIIIEKIDALCKTFETLAKAGKPADLTWAFRCMTVDIITYLCFGKSVDAIHAPKYKAPIIVAMDAALPVFKRFKHSETYKNMIQGCPPKISKVVSPATAGLVDLQLLLQAQIKELTDDPATLERLPHSMTIYHQLMNKEAYRSGTAPSAGSLYEEAQALMFAGSDTSGNVLLLGSYYLLKQADNYAKLKEELRDVWPSLDAAAPSLRELEQRPYLNAVIKESLRMSCGVVSGLLRIVPAQGATIAGHAVPGGAIVSCSSYFVHYNDKVFPHPFEFRPERWLNNPDLDKWLVSFSRGPRSCLGINLGWAEMRLAFAYFYRRFDLKLNSASPKELKFGDGFLAYFKGDHVMADLQPATA